MHYKCSIAQAVLHKQNSEAVNYPVRLTEIRLNQCTPLPYHTGSIPVALQCFNMTV